MDYTTTSAKDANWRAAMEEEMHALAKNETWDLVDAPKGVKSLSRSEVEGSRIPLVDFFHNCGN